MRKPKNDGKVFVPILDRIAQLRTKLLEKKPNLRMPALAGSNSAADIHTVAKLLSCLPSTFYPRGGRPAAAFVAIENLVHEFGVMNLRDFKDAGGLADDMIVGAYVECPSQAAVARYRQFLIDNDLRVPESTRCKGQIYGSLIAQEIGICPSRLVSTGPSRAAVTAIADEIGLMSAKDYVKARMSIAPMAGSVDATAPSQADSAAGHDTDKKSKLLAHLKLHHMDNLAPLPASNRNINLPAYRSIFLSADVPFKGLGAEHELCAVIDAAGLAVGVGPARVKPLLPSFKTFGDLMSAGKQHFQLLHGCVAPANLGRFVWALNTVMKAVGATLSMPIDDTMSTMLNDVVSQCAANIHNKNTKQQFLAAMREWQRVFKFSQIADGGLPETFAGAFAILFKRSGYKSVRDLCRAAKIKDMQPEVQNWLKGLTAPASADEMVIRAIEAALGAASNTLISRVGFNRDFEPNYHIPVSKRPTALRGNVKLWGLVRPLLPAHFLHLPESERERIGDCYFDEYTRTSEYREKLRSRKKWRLPALPADLQAEWDQLVRYKTAIVAPHPRVTTWRAGTVDRNLNVMLEFFSVLVLPLEEGGLALKPGHLCLAMVGVPAIVQHYFQWLRERSPDGMHTGTRTIIGLFANLTAEEAGEQHGNKAKRKAAGYLHYQAKLTARLAPIAGLVSATDISWLRSDGWASALKETNEYVWSVMHETEDSWVFSRNPFAEILPILHSARPMDALIDLLRQLYNALPSARLVTALTRAMAIRRFVGSLILVRTALRLKNVRELTYDPAGNGKIRKVEGHWVIEIPAKEFKNSSGRYFRENKARGNPSPSYFFKFPKEDTPILDEYAFISRPTLCGGVALPPVFFVTEGGGKLGLDAISHEMREHSWQYLVYHEASRTGIKGLMSFGAHAIRSITATHILKVTGDPLMAANAIQDSVETVLLHYAQFCTADKQELVSRFLDKDLGSAYG
ncbi:hypothetical protein [Novosphingobium taihuense]|nr:hypothetical protein [Novosphingobium taihuense]TWH79706.1 hypothetical protein IQ25_03917 [Novosphingobium taihuense]